MISVIIPTLNRAALLEKTLVSLTQQTIRETDFEVLVIDNGSTDSTADVVTKFSSHLNIKCFLEKNPGLHEGRHRGVRESSGEILVYADDDIKALPSWIEGIAESFKEPKVGLVGGKNIPDYESPPPDWLDKFWVATGEGKHITYFSLLDFGDTTRLIDPHYVFGCNFSIRKSIVLDAKGFHPDGMPESLIKFRGDGETHVARHVTKMGFQTVYNPKVSVKHWVPSSRMNMAYLNKRSFSEGITQSYVDTRAKYLSTDAPERAKETTLSRLKEKVKSYLLDDSKKQIKQSFLAGYNFHQQELIKDKDLLPWVLRDTYMTSKQRT